MPAFDVYIGRHFAGRAAGFGNPLRLLRSGTPNAAEHYARALGWPQRSEDTPLVRAEMLVAYWAWLNGPSTAANAMRRRVHAGELTGAVLG